MMRRMGRPTLAMRATKTLRGVTAAWIKEQRVKLENGQIAEYQVNMEVTFILDA
jgi:flavin-binding protein dodecin